MTMLRKKNLKEAIIQNSYVVDIEKHTLQPSNLYKLGLGKDISYITFLVEGEQNG